MVSLLALVVALQCGGATSTSPATLTAPAGVQVSGTVLDAGTLKPLPNAQILLTATSACAQLADRLGRFRFPALSAGKYVVEVSFLGYQTVRDSFLVAPGASLDLDITLDQTAIPIAPIKVNVRSQFLDRIGFYDRRSAGIGAFLTRADIEKQNGIAYASDVVRNVRGVRVIPRRGHGGNRIVGRSSCGFRYFMDGARTDPQFELDDIEPQYIEALEIYTGPGEVPPQYSSVSGLSLRSSCGVIVIWTRQKR